MTAASFLYQNVSTLKSINRVKQRHKCHSLSEICSADGKEINTRYTMKFPCKATRNNHDRPIKSHITVNDYRVWKKFLLCLCKDETLILTDPLGQWKYHSITEWNTTWDWFVRQDSRQLYHNMKNNSWEVHSRRFNSHYSYVTPPTICTTHPVGELRRVTVSILQDRILIRSSVFRVITDKIEEI